MKPLTPEEKRLAIKAAKSMQSERHARQEDAEWNVFCLCQQHNARMGQWPCPRDLVSRLALSLLQEGRA
jgi:hypothetical protein